jgi:hypothetical protein
MHVVVAGGWPEKQFLAAFTAFEFAAAHGDGEVPIIMCGNWRRRALPGNRYVWD